MPAERRSGALVVGFRRDDPRRMARARAAAARRAPIWTPYGPAPSEGIVRRELSELDCTLMGGYCVGCGCAVYLNTLGISAVRERDADVACSECESLYGADITRSL